MQKVGEMSIPSGEIVITDPCYLQEKEDREREDLVTRLKCESGPFDVFVGFHDETGRVNKVILSNHKKSAVGDQKVEEKNLFVCVDSGQMGFFDSKMVDENIDKFYDLACDLTNPIGFLAERGFGTRTGWGDGSYLCKYRMNGGKFRHAEIRFMQGWEEYDED